MGAVDELREAVEQAYPRYDEHAGDWDEVLRRATTAKPPRRSPWLLRGAIAAGAAVVLAVLLVAPWKSNTGIVDRALAAISDGPVLHMVVRSEAKGEFAPLKGGPSTPVYDDQELWWDPSRGLHQVARFGGRAYLDGISRGLPRPEDDPLPMLLVKGYRKALDSGQAKVVGDGEIAGHKVTWIRFQAYGEAGATIDVAIDRTTAKPVFARFKPGGNAGVTFGRRVLLTESLPAGAGNFEPRPVPKRLGFSPFGSAAGTGLPLDRGRARAFLSAPPLWLGKSYSGQPLQGFQGTTVSPNPSKPPTAEQLFAVDVVYGPSRSAPFDGSSPWVRITEQPRLKFELGYMEVNEDRIWRTIKPGYVLVYSGAESQTLPPGQKHISAGYLKLGGLYVRITAPTDDLVVSAARALRPMR